MIELLKMKGDDTLRTLPDIQKGSKRNLSGSTGGGAVSMASLPSPGEFSAKISNSMSTVSSKANASANTGYTSIKASEAKKA